MNPPSFIPYGEEPQNDGAPAFIPYGEEPQEDRAPSWLDSFRQAAEPVRAGLAQVPAGIAESYGGLLKMAEEAWPETMSAMPAPFKADHILDNAQAWRDWVNANVPTEEGTWDQRIKNVSEGLPTLGLQLVGGSALPIAARFGAEAAGGTYGGMRQADVAPEDAARAAAVSGAGNAALGALMPYLGGGAGAKTLLGNIARSSGMFAGLAPIFEGLNAATQYAGTGEVPSVMEFLNRVKETGIEGAMTGGVLGAVHGAMPKPKAPESPKLEEPALPALEAKVETAPSPDKAVVQGYEQMLKAPEKYKGAVAEGALEAKPVAEPMLPDQRGSLPIGEIAAAPKDVAVRMRDSLLTSDKDIQKAPESERFMQGIMPAQALPRSLVKGYREQSLFLRTIAQKFPQAEPAYQATLKRFEDKAEISSELHQLAKPYFRLNEASRARLDEFLMTERKTAAAALKSGKGELRPMTEEVLRDQFKLTPQEIEAYRGVRSAMNRSLDYIEEKLLLDGESINGQQNKLDYELAVKDYIDTLRAGRYVPASRFGTRYDVTAKDAKGVTVYREFFDSMTEAKKAKKEQESRGYKVTAVERSAEKADAYAELPPGIADRLKEFDADKWDKLADKGQLTGFGKHLAHATLTEGYEKSLTRPVADYILGLSDMVSRKRFDVSFKEAMKQIPENETSLRSLIQRKVEALDRDRNMVERGMLSAVNLWTLAGSPASGLTNLSQPFLTTLPEIVRYQGAKAPLTFGKAGGQLLDYLFTGGKHINPELKGMLDRGVKKGLVEAQTLTELSRLRQGYTGKMGVQDALMLTFTLPEKWNRIHALASGFNVGKAQGLRGPALEKFADNFVLETQFDMSRANKPLAMENMAGAMAGQYRRFMGNYFRFLRNRMNPKDWKAAATSIGVLYSLGGMLGVPGVRDLTATLEGLGVDVRQALRRFFSDKDYANSHLYGLPTLAGWNVSGNVGVGELMPAIDRDPYASVGRLALGPAGDLLLSRPWKALSALKEGEPAIAAETAAPRFARGLIRAGRAAKAGKLEDVRGQTLIEDPTKNELLQMGLGFTPQRLAETYERRHSADVIDRRATSEKASFNTSLAKAIKDGDRERVLEVLSQGLEQGLFAEEDINRTFATAKRKAEEMQDPELKLLQRAPKRVRPEIFKLLESFMQ